MAPPLPDRWRGDLPAHYFTAPKSGTEVPVVTRRPGRRGQDWSLMALCRCGCTHGRFSGRPPTRTVNIVAPGILYISEAYIELMVGDINDQIAIYGVAIGNYY